MLVNRIIFLLLLICFSNSLQAQDLSKPILVGTWSGGEDFGEFIWHRTEALSYYLKQDPTGRIVIRLCSKDRLPLALASSNGFAFTFPTTASTQGLSLKNIYLTTYAGCARRAEEYWFVPKDGRIDHGEIISAESVTTKRWISSYYKEFQGQIRQFINEHKLNPQPSGFIIRNIGIRDSKFRYALKIIRGAKIEKNRFQIVDKRVYSSVYPEFMTVSIF